MKRAAKVCTADPSCPELQPCPVHQRKPWAKSNGRRNRMRSGSREQQINRAVMERDNGQCHVCGLHGADEVDHVVPLAEGGSDGMENRRPIHSEPCHRVKTAEERARAQTRNAA